MEYNKFLETIKKFKEGLVEEKKDYIPLIIVEQVLQKKITELNNKFLEYQNHISMLFGRECIIEFDKKEKYWINIKFNEGIFSQYNCIITFNTSWDINPIITYSKNGKSITITKLKDSYNNNYFIDLLKKDTKTIEFLKYVINWQNLYLKNYIGIKTNIGLFVNLFQSNRDVRVLVGDNNYNIKYERYCIRKNVWKELIPKGIPFDETITKIPRTYDFPSQREKHWEAMADEGTNFYYYKDESTHTKEIHFESDKVKDILNETDIGKIYAALTIDTSYFTPELQEEFKLAYLTNSAGLEEEKKKQINKLKQKQIERIKEAYKLFKELAELLNNSKLDDLKLEKIKLDDIEKIFFKNNGLPNEDGYIEISEFFRNNMILRMIDLSTIDLTNVDIRNMDFSGTNIQINPQTIYNKDMTNVNAKGVHFPFYYSFEDTILDGCIIDDWEAMIDLDKVKSYNNSTYINKANKKK